MMNEDKNKDKISKIIGFQIKKKVISSSIGTNNIVLQDQRTSSVSMDMMMMCHRKSNDSDEQQQQQQPPPPSVENNDMNSSLRLQTSYCSTHSNESDLSIALELELNAINMNVESDELPAFKIRTMSPLGRSPSPIDTCNISDINIDLDLEETPTRLSQSHLQYRNPCQDDPNFVALHEINAQISPPSDDGGGSDTNNLTLSRTNSLETIFENMFLHTPPQQQRNNGGSHQKGAVAAAASSNTPKRRRSNLFERMTLNRLHAGKENQSPANNRSTTPKRHIIPHKVGPNEELLSPSFTNLSRELFIDSNSVTNQVAATTSTAIDSVMIEWNANPPKIE